MKKPELRTQITAMKKEQRKLKRALFIITPQETSRQVLYMILDLIIVLVTTTALSLRFNGLESPSSPFICGITIQIFGLQFLIYISLTSYAQKYVEKTYNVKPAYGDNETYQWLGTLRQILNDLGIKIKFLQMFEELRGNSCVCDDVLDLIFGYTFRGGTDLVMHV